MKKIYSFIISFFLLTPLVAQTCEWAYGISQPERTTAPKVRQDSKSNYYFVTYTDSIIRITQSYIEKRDINQNKLWSKTIRGVAAITDFEIKPNDNVILLGHFEKNLTIDAVSVTGAQDYITGFICELKPDGDVVWLKKIDPGFEGIMPYDLFIAKNGDFYFTADLYNSNAGFVSFHKADASGNVLKSRVDSSYRLRTITNIIADEKGNVYVNGTNEQTNFDTIPKPSDEPYQLFLAGYNSDFKAQWVHIRPYITFDHSSTIERRGDTILWLYCDIDTTNRIELHKVSLSGTLLDSVDLPAPMSFFPYAKFDVSHSGYMTLVYSYYSKFVLHQFDPSYNLMFVDTVKSVCMTDFSVAAYDSVFYFTGTIGGDSTMVGGKTVLNPNSNLNFPCGFMLSKWSHPFTPQPLDVVKMSAMEMNIYPNPAYEKIHVSLRGQWEGSFNISDATGREILMGELTADSDAIDVSNLCDGIYMLRIQTGSGSYCARVVLKR